MTLLFIDGFDAYGVNAASVAAECAAAGYLANATSTTLSSDTATGVGFSVYANSGPRGSGGGLVRAFAGAAGLCVGFRFKADTSAYDGICQLGYTNLLGSFVDHIKLVLNGQNGISVGTEDPSSHHLSQAGFGAPTTVGSLIAASPPNVLFVGVWQYIEVLFVVGALLQVRIDGATVINVASPGSSAGLPPAINYFNLSNLQNAGGRYDDMYICDTNGASFNTFLGDVVVHAVFPNGDGGANQFAQIGGTGAGHFTSVDELTPDGDASYLSSNTTGQIELFTTPTLPADIVDVLAVAVNTSARKQAVGIGSYASLLDLSGVQSVSATLPTALGYVTQQSLFASPPGGGTWTLTSAQNAKFGVKIV